MQIYFKKKKTGGISFNSTCTLTHVDEKLCYQILHEYKIHNAEAHHASFFPFVFALLFAIFYLKSLIGFSANINFLFTSRFSSVKMPQLMI
jgi:hypothetical protein